jgi:hypothetical protein
MERNEEFSYDRGDILYMAGGTIAAIGDTLGHRWARYLDKDFWEAKLNGPEATEARAEWLREAYEILKEHRWKEYDRILQEGLTTAATFIIIRRASRVDSGSGAAVSLERPWPRPFTHEARTKSGSPGLGSWAAKAWPT